MYQKGDVVLLPFPFTDLTATRHAQRSWSASRCSNGIQGTSPLP